MSVWDDFSTRYRYARRLSMHGEEGLARELVFLDTETLCAKHELFPEFPGGDGKAQRGKYLSKDEAFQNVFFFCERPPNKEHIDNSYPAEHGEIIRDLVSRATSVTSGTEAVYKLLVDTWRSRIVYDGKFADVDTRVAFCRNVLAVTSTSNMTKVAHVDRRMAQLSRPNSYILTQSIAARTTVKQYSSMLGHGDYREDVEQYSNASEIPNVLDPEIFTAGDYSLRKVCGTWLYTSGEWAKVSQLEWEMQKLLDPDDLDPTGDVATDVIERGPLKGARRLFILDEDQMLQVFQTINAACSLLEFMYWSAVSDNSRSELDFREMCVAIELAMTAMESARGDDCAYVAGGYKKAWDVALTALAGDFQPESCYSTYDDLMKSPYGKHVQFDKFFALLRTTSLANLPQVGRISKMFPTPTFDIADVFLDNWKKMITKNPDQFQTNTVVGRASNFYTHPYTDWYHADDAEPTLRGFRAYLRRLWVASMINKQEGRKHGIGRCRNPDTGALCDGRVEPFPFWWKVYRGRGFLPKSLLAFEWIDLSGTVKFEPRPSDDISVLKDKAVALDTVEECMEEHPEHPEWKNLLTRFLDDGKMPSAWHDWGKWMLSLKRVIYMVGLKGEAAKAKSRAFYISQLLVKYYQNWYDSCVGVCCEHIPEYQVGKTPQKKEESLLKLLQDANLFSNDDYAEWSPGQRKAVQILADELFSHLSGLDFISSSADVMCGGPVPTWTFRGKNGAGVIKQFIGINRAGYIGKFEGVEDNKQGLDGKKMTFVGTCLVGYNNFIAALKMNRQSLPKTVSMVFIDDLTSSGRVAAANSTAIWGTYLNSHVFTAQAMAFLLHLAKRNAGLSLSVFLNELFYNGVSLTYGARAALRIGRTKYTKVDAFPKWVAEIVSGMEGVLKCGGKNWATYCLGLSRLVSVLEEWGMRDYGVLRKVAYAMRVNVCHGFMGLQFPLLIHLCNNCADHPLIETVGFLQNVMEYHRQEAQIARAILTQPLQRKTVLEVLTAPKKVDSAIASFVQDRIGNAMMDAFRKKASSRAGFGNPVLRGLIALADSHDARAIAAALQHDDQVVEITHTQIDNLNAALADHVVRSFLKKFQTSSSRSSLVSLAEQEQIASENQADFFDTHRGFLSLMRIHSNYTTPGVIVTGPKKVFATRKVI